MRKRVRNTTFARRAMLWQARKQNRDSAVKGLGGEKLENQRKKEAKHKQGVFNGKGKEEAVEKRQRPSSEEGNESYIQQHEGVGGSRTSGEAVKRKREKCPHNRNIASASHAAGRASASKTT
jgi:hypothetical protein